MTADKARMNRRFAAAALAMFIVVLAWQLVTATSARCEPSHVDLLRMPDETDAEFEERWRELAFGHC